MNNLQFCHSFWLLYIIFYDFTYFGSHFGLKKMATKPNYQKLVTNDQEPNPNDYFFQFITFLRCYIPYSMILPILVAILDAILNIARVLGIFFC